MGMTGILRTIFTKLGYSVDGVKVAFRDEPSFRQWALLVLVSDCAVLLLGYPPAAAGAVFALGFLLLASELINTAVEILVDHVHPERGDVAKRAKDTASAMTLLTFLALASFWCGLLLF
ncbi:MAG: diacylglycerol kinase [Rhodobacteraceae bacterium]|nr:diacylglycerol kinase [Paracoccaceae bacterium]